MGHWQLESEMGGTYEITTGHLKLFNTPLNHEHSYSLLRRPFSPRVTSDRTTIRARVKAEDPYRYGLRSNVTSIAIASWDDAGIPRRSEYHTDWFEVVE